MASPDPLTVAVNRLVTAVDRLTHAIEALIRLELAAEYRRQEDDRD